MHWIGGPGGRNFLNPILGLELGFIFPKLVKVGGRQNNVFPPTPATIKDVHILIPRTYDYISYVAQRILQMWLKLRKDLVMEESWIIQVGSP